jgi:hypothetical protein
VYVGYESDYDYPDEICHKKHKYVARIKTSTGNNGAGYRYFYTTEEYKAYLNGKKQPNNVTNVSSLSKIKKSVNDVKQRINTIKGDPSYGKNRKTSSTPKNIQNVTSRNTREVNVDGQTITVINALKAAGKNNRLIPNTKKTTNTTKERANTIKGDPSYGKNRKESPTSKSLQNIKNGIKKTASDPKERVNDVKNDKVKNKKPSNKFESFIHSGKAKVSKWLDKAGDFFKDTWDSVESTAKTATVKIKGEFHEIGEYVSDLLSNKSGNNNSYRTDDAIKSDYDNFVDSARDYISEHFGTSEKNTKSDESFSEKINDYVSNLFGPKDKDKDGFATDDAIREDSQDILDDAYDYLSDKLREANKSDNNNTKTDDAAREDAKDILDEAYEYLADLLNGENNRNRRR